MITLRAALRLEPMRHGLPAVLCGEDRLDRPLRWAHAGEVPNMPELLKGGELLLTTGMGIGPTERDRRRYVDRLADREVTGLVIELGSTFAEVPPEIVDQAHGRGLPVVALHREIRFVEVTEAVHREIVNRQLVLVRRGEELHKRFTELMLDGAGIPDVLAVLAEALANPVILEKAGHGIIYHETHHADEATVLAAWDAHRRGVTDAFDTIEHPVPMAGHDHWGSLVALALDSPVHEFDRVAIERAVGLIALALMRDREEQLLATRERGNFLVQVLEQDIDEQQAGARAAALGFVKGNRQMLCFAAVPSPSLGNRSSDEAAWALVWRDVRRALADRGVPFLIGSRGIDAEMLGVLGTDGGRSRADMASEAAALIARTAEDHLGDPGTAVISVGRLATSWYAVRRGLREALDAVWAAGHSPPRPWHDATEPNLDRLFWSLRDQPALQSFVSRRLHRLREHDARRSAKLVPTLEVLCRHGGRKADAARELHVERQTLYYRLSRIEQLLDIDLSDGDALLALHLALRAERHLPGTAAAALEG